MTLTQAQLTAYKADILANTDPVVVNALANGQNQVITDWYNQATSPAYWVLRKMVPENEIREAIFLKDIADITTADSQRAVHFLTIKEGFGFTGENPIVAGTPQPSQSERQAWSDVFSAAAGDESQQAIDALWTRPATNFERIFADAGGNANGGGIGLKDGSSAANADTTSLQQEVTLQDTRDAINL